MTTEHDQDDGALLRRWATGDRAAGRALSDRHFGLVYRFFLTKAPALPEDLVQQTFIAALKAAGRYDDSRGSFRAFLLGVARRELLMAQRKQAREARALGRVADEAKRAQSSPSGDVAHRQDLALLLRALRRIPLEQQVLVELYYWEELSVAEAAAVLEIPAGTVKSRLSRAREQLRDALAQLQMPDAVIDSTLDDFQAWAAALRGAPKKNDV